MLWSFGSGRCAGAMSACAWELFDPSHGEGASPHVVSRAIIRLSVAARQKAQLFGAMDGRAAGVDAKLLVNVLGVCAHRVAPDHQLAGDFRAAQIAAEQAEHIQFAVAERFDQVGVRRQFWLRWAKSRKQSAGIGWGKNHLFGPLYKNQHT